MNGYDSNDLQSTLLYIKDRFGINVFSIKGRVSALLSDLAPNLKSDRVLLERMSRLGILEEFVSTNDSDESLKKRLVSRAMTQLIQTEYIRPAIAATYLSTLINVFGWKIEVEIPRESSFEKMKFDSIRYMQESQDSDFLLGKKAYENDRFHEAKLHLTKSYGKGNVLAGRLLGEIYYSGKGCERNYDKAVSLFVDGMQRGCPLSAEWLAEAYRVGKGVPQDKEKAKEIYDSCVEALEAMCVSGSSDAQYVYGFDLLYGNFSEENEQKAFYWLEKAMNAGHISAGVQVAKIYLNGWGIERNEQKGIEILEKYSNSENNNIHFELGKIYYIGKVKEQNYTKALKHFMIAAEKGHANSQEYVGEIYYWGHGVEIDYLEAKKWYDKAAENGNKYSLRQLGFIYYYGEGVSRDLDVAFKYFKFAADRGDSRAQYMLHHFYLFDEAYKNVKMGIEYLEKSAKQGDVLAQKLLARCYISGLGFEEDDEKFVYWMRLAAEQNDAEAQRILGEAYIRLDNPKVLPKSYSEAVQLLNKAAHQGDIQAYILLAEIYFTGEDIEKDEEKALNYLQSAENKVKELEKSGKFMTDEHKKLGDLYYEIYSDTLHRQYAFDHYTKVFSTGNRDVTYDVGWMYFINNFESIYLKEDTEEILQIIIQEESKSTSSSLAYLLGKIYENGYKVSIDKREAEKWFKKASEKGSLAANCRLAFYYINECQLYDKGFSLLEDAYNHGSVEATRLLGICYKKGISVKKNRKKAKELLKEAANKGDTDAMDELKKFIF